MSMPQVTDVWLLPLQVGQSRLQQLHGVLSDDEVARAARFRFPHHARRFIAARGLLRSILSRYTDEAPADTRFDYSEFGKPRLVQSAGAPAVYFNLSHSVETAVVAVTRSGETGIDIEFIHPRFEFQEIVAHWFSPEEVAPLTNTQPEHQRLRFYEIWTRKEAYVKAYGCGLSMSTTSFTVFPEVRVENPWRIRPLAVDSSFVGALATPFTTEIRYKSLSWLSL